MNIVPFSHSRVRGTGAIGPSLRLALALVFVLSAAAPAVAYAQAADPPLPAGWPCSSAWIPSGNSRFAEPQPVAVCQPAQWNGILVVYAHGYVAPQDPTVSALGISQQEIDALTPVIPVLLSQGFAFAVTGYSKRGYAVEPAGDNLEQLVSFYQSQLGTPLKVYLVGASEGGLITTMQLEKHPEMYAGGLAMCGPVGGMPYQVKYLGDFRVVFDYFFDDVFPFGASNVPDTAWQSWGTDTALIANAIGSQPNRTKQLYDVTQAARNPQDLAGSSITTAVGDLWYSIWGTPDLLATTGGQPFDNRLTWYSGSSNDRKLNRQVERVASSDGARAYVKSFYQTTGQLTKPLVTLHNLYDPAVPFRHELFYAGLVLLHGQASNLVVLPVPGYGHCSFTQQQVLGAFTLLLQRSGVTVPASMAPYLSTVPAVMPNSAGVALPIP